jgi:hypothetical protein
MAPKGKKSSAVTSTLHKEKPKKRRKGIHAKNSASKSKKSKNYVKLSRGQG